MKDIKIVQYQLRFSHVEYIFLQAKTMHCFVAKTMHTVNKHTYHRVYLFITKL